MSVSTARLIPAFATSGTWALRRSRHAISICHRYSHVALPRPSLRGAYFSRSRARRLAIRCASDPSASSPTSARLSALRAELSRRDVSAFIVPSADAHNSEYAPASFARRAFISSFSGSAGTAVVTADGAFLWTDGRYFLQAEQQLDENWTLMRAGLPDTPTIPDFLAKTLPKGSAVGIDPFVHSIDSAKALRKALEEVGCSLVGLEVPNPVDVVWGEERPAQPNGAVWPHGVRFAGETAQEKIGKLREQMKEKGCDHVLFSMLDEVCWLFNIRGDDIPHCPVVMSYALVSKEEARLYVDKEKLGEFVEEALVKEGVTVLPYEQVLGDVGGIAARESEKIWLDPSSTSQALSDAAAEAGVRETTPVQMAKACKNEAELRGMREAHLKDGVALSSFLCWVENYVSSGENTISEVDAAAKLREFRAAQEGFLATSFGTIAGSGPNGAIIHYSPTPGECGYISNKDVLLLDSGGQYEDGTTDVTRTMHLGGSATEHEKECFTRVLQGHIAIDNAVFPEDTTGLMLDSLARMPLWSIGLDYRHGTGHGVGACLNVHEGPQSISPRLGSNRAGLKAGMILSNEPGYYEDGNFGVRIENLLIVVKKNTAHEFGGKDFLGFERLTHAPMDTRMIMTNLLSDSEVRWVNTYHEDVWQKLSPRMEDGQYKEWLWEKTRPLPERSSSNPATSRQSSVTRAGV